MPHNRQKKVAVINDFCGFGRCSLTVSIPIISAMKLQCCPLPTAIFSNHTGYDRFYHTDFTDHMDAYIDEWKALDLRFEGILTGYLGSPHQIDIVKRFCERFAANGTLTVVDPVMGDNGKLYASYSPALAAKMKELLPLADVITPNLTEACLLADVPYREDMTEADLTSLCETLATRGPRRMVISGLSQGDELWNFLYEVGCPPTIVRERKVGPCRAGTGDVFSSVLTADLVNGVTLFDAVTHASSFIAKALHRTVERDLPDTDGLCFEDCLTEL